MSRARHVRSGASYVDVRLSEPNEPRYTLRSARLTYSGTTLTYHDGRENHCFQFSELYLPATAAQPKVTRLSDYPQYVDILLAAADLRIDRSKEGLPAGRALTRQIYLIRHLLDWLRSRGIYRLSDAGEDDTRELLVQLAHGGWGHALSLAARWTTAIEQIEAAGIDLSDAFHLRNEGGFTGIETLLQPFWRARLGWGGVAPLTSDAKSRMEAALSSRWQFTKGWTGRKITDSNAPSTFVLRNIIGWLNDLSALPASVDRLQHKVATSANRSSRKISTKPSSRTANLQLHDAIKLIGTALKLLYETAPMLVELIDDARAIYPNVSQNARMGWLYTSAARQRLEQALGKPITHWAWSGHHGRDPASHTVDEILAAVQGACAIILAAMNARRQAEICDRHLGVRIGDLTVLDDQLGLYQCWFYIEKTYRDRHIFYVNRASADALRCLEKLKLACAPFGFNDVASPSLFECGRYVELGPRGSAHFSFTDDSGRTRSLISFLKIAYDERDKVPEISSHMFRRFYAILYYHKYEHAELRALKQHLRHLDVAMTRVYITDPSVRPLAEQICSALGNVDDHVVAPDLRSSLESRADDLEQALDGMGREKLRMAVDEILAGNPSAGGFSKIVRKLYRQMHARLVAHSGKNSSAADQITELFETHGYRVKPMQHGQCHAPDTRRNLRGACEQDGTLAREHASPRVCAGCPFHFNNIAYVANLKERLAELEADCDNFLLSPQHQARAMFDYKNLEKLIELIEKQMTLNSKTIMELSTAAGASKE